MNPKLIQRMPLSHFSYPEPSKVRRVDVPKVKLKPAVAGELIEACRKNRDEVCGLITDQQEILYVPNTHAEPRFNFYMSIEHLRENIFEIAQVKGQRVIGVFHTHHTNIPWPSPVDINGWPNPNLGWRYWIVTQHEVVEWAKDR